MRLAWGTVDEIIEQGTRVQRLAVTLSDGTTGVAVNYPQLAGVCAPGEAVLLNTTAVDLRLGTGGEHFVVARDRDADELDVASGGHIMKLRYTPLQFDVLAVEESASPYAEAMASTRSLDGMPVVCCGLHSQVPLVAAAVKARRPEARVAYCMTDQAALPLGVSRIVERAEAVGLLDATITCGQAFGGDVEAINVHSGLLAAEAVADADVAIVALGPGIVGTGTPFGHGGVAQGEAINAAAALGGTPIAVLRVSFADPRERHRVVSHHTLTALASVALARSIVAVPELDDALLGPIDGALESAGVWAKHVRRASAGIQPDLRGLEVRTMGRAIEDDPAFFAAAFAAGEVAASVLQTEGR